ncbi:hypothetical protein NE570_18130 [Eubacterium callanderi]|nr:hypothetical protein [Eubacterium callanderi]
MKRAGYSLFSGKVLFFTVKTVKNKIFNKKILDKNLKRFIISVNKKKFTEKTVSKKDYTKKYIDPERCTGF